MDFCRWSRSRSKLVFALILTATIGIGFGARALAGVSALEASDHSFDFGHAGIDFKLFHTFSLRNSGQKDIYLHTANVPCECTSVLISDTLLKPGEVTNVRVALDTYSLYGPSSKQFSISTSDPATPSFVYPYFATVGQWPMGFKPDPINLFFLPGHKAKRLTIPNPTYDKINVTLIDQADTVYTVTLVRASARKGERAEVEVTPKDNIRPGTYFSSFRLQLALPDNTKPVLINIPVKIVRY